MMNILAIGNSFSQDATRYLGALAAARGEPCRVVNLYIGGCSLELHHQNLLSDARAYSLEYGGETTGFFTSVREALTANAWDVVTLQQASLLSPRPETYFPHVNVLADTVRSLAPTARLLLHQTWGYEDNSALLASVGFATHAQMSRAVCAAYAEVAAAANADGILPSGEVISALAAMGLTVHRDTFHLSLGIGRYAAALTWWHTLFPDHPATDASIRTDEPLSPALREQIEQCARAVVAATTPFHAKGGRLP